MPTKKKTTKPKKAGYSKEIAEFICGEIEKGLNLSEIVQKYSKKLPTTATIYEWRRKHSEFNEMFFIATQSKLYGYLDELDTLSRTPLPDTQDLMRFRKIDSDRKIRVDTLKFIAAKITPKFITELADKPQVAIGINSNGDGETKIQVVNYALPGETPLLVDKE